MKLLAELYTLIAEAKAKKAPPKQTAKEKAARDSSGNMVVSKPDPEDGNERVSEGSEKVTVPTPKPRNKQLHDTLRSKKGGRMTSAKTDYNRSAEKRKTKTAVDEQ
jgi:hypothetical protein